MSKSVFSRVKYPSRKEINNQINDIIEQSHLFDVDQNTTGYVHCRKVKKSFFSSNLATVAIVLAAFVIAVLCVAPFISKSRSSQATSNPGETETETESYYVESDITGTRPADNKTAVRATVAEPILMRDGSLFNVYFNYMPIKVSVNDQSLSYVEDYYKNLQTTAWNRISELYVKPQADMKEKDIISVVVSNKLESSNYKVYDSGQYMVCLSNVFERRKQYMKEDKENYYIAREDMCVDTFYSDKEAPLTYMDILKDYNSGLDAIAQLVYEETRENINVGIEGITDTYKSVDTIKEALINNSSWKLGLNAITIYCNEYRTYQNISYQAGETTTFHSFVLKYDEYDIIKDEYK